MASILVSVPLTDIGGRRGTINYFFEGGTAQGDIQARMTATLEALDDVTGAVIGVPLITLPLVTGALTKQTATAGSVLYEGLNFNFRAAGTNYTYTQRVPAVLPAFLPAYGSPTVTGTPLETYANNITENVADQPDYTDEYENDLTTFLGVAPSRRKA